MAAIKELQQSLNAIFGTRAARKPGTDRKHREWAKPVAVEYGIEIERCDSGWNVWPPKALTKASGWSDNYEGDHYCQSWGEIRTMVADYAHDCARYAPKATA